MYLKVEVGNILFLTSSNAWLEKRVALGHSEFAIGTFS
jgi:hypothetical protein